MGNKMRIKIAILLSAIVLLSGCATIIARNLKGYNEDWEINIIEMKDGPNEVNRTVVFTVRPNQGYRFIWVTLQAKNRSNEPQTINLKKISLISGSVQSYPFNLNSDGPPDNPSSNNLTLDPQQSAKRLIIFSFPVNIQPKTIRIPDFNDIPVE
jgi:hypothetical protein